MEREDRPGADGWGEPAGAAERALLSSRGAAAEAWRPGCDRSPLFFSRADLESSGDSGSEDGCSAGAAARPSAQHDAGLERTAAAKSATSLIRPPDTEPPPAHAPPTTGQSSSLLVHVRRVRRKRSGSKPSRRHRSGGAASAHRQRHGRATRHTGHCSDVEHESSTIELGDALADGANPPRGAPPWIWHTGPPTRVPARSPATPGELAHSNSRDADLPEQLRRMSWQNAACVTALSLNALHLHAQSMLTHTPRRLRRNIVAVRTEAIRARREADQAGDARAALAAERATHAATRAKLAELERQRSGHADGAAGGGHGFCHCGAARAARHLSSAVARASAVRTELVAGLRPLPALCGTSIPAADACTILRRVRSRVDELITGLGDAASAAGGAGGGDSGGVEGAAEAWRAALSRAEERVHLLAQTVEVLTDELTARRSEACSRLCAGPGWPRR